MKIANIHSWRHGRKQLVLFQKLAMVMVFYFLVNVNCEYEIVCCIMNNCIWCCIGTKWEYVLYHVFKRT